MRLARRRFIAITAAALGTARVARAETVWRGQALGAEATITLRGPDAPRALGAALETIARMDALFSLHRADSTLAALNRDGVLHGAPPDLLALLDLCDDVHAATRGGFDPTIQPFWRVLAASAPLAPDPAALALARSCIGWPLVRREAGAIRFARPGMALTLNGIAQGYATDRAAQTLRDHGFDEVLVDLGEIRAGAGSWRIGIEDPALGPVATRTLSRMAIATSSPGALRFGPSGPAHILDPAAPERPALWSTVSVESPSAALADAFSTAFCHMPAARIAALRAARPDLNAVVLVTAEGNLRTI